MLECLRTPTALQTPAGKRRGEGVGEGGGDVHLPRGGRARSATSRGCFRQRARLELRCAAVAENAGAAAAAACDSECAGRINGEDEASSMHAYQTTVVAFQAGGGIGRELLQRLQHIELQKRTCCPVTLHNSSLFH